MPNASKAWWRDVKIYSSKDVPWRVKCRRVVEHVFRVFCFGSENWSWSRGILDSIKGWETKVMRRLFCFKKNEGSNSLCLLTQGEVCLWLFVLCVCPLSRFRPLSFLVLSLSLLHWFSSSDLEWAAMVSMDPGNGACGKCFGRCHYDRWKEGMDL